MYQTPCHSLKIMGMTLIELLFSLTLTLLIVGSISGIYLASVKNHFVEESLKTIQQNTRITFQLLNNALRAAGNIGCAKLTKDFPISFSGPYNMTPENWIQPYHGSEMKSGTDAFTARYASSLNGTLVETMNKFDTLHMSSSPKTSEGDVLIISDCKTVDFFVVQHVSIHSDGTQLLTSENNISKIYEKNSEISEFEMNTFYIGKTDRKDYFGSPVYALYKKDIFSHKTELVEGINDMQIHYSVLENNHIIEKNTNEIKFGDFIIGISLKMNFVSLSYFSLQKTAYSDIAFRKN